MAQPCQASVCNGFSTGDTSVPTTPPPQRPPEHEDEPPVLPPLRQARKKMSMMIPFIGIGILILFIGVLVLGVIRQKEMNNAKAALVTSQNEVAQLRQQQQQQQLQPPPAPPAPVLQGPPGMPVPPVPQGPSAEEIAKEDKFSRNIEGLKNPRLEDSCLVKLTDRDEEAIHRIVWKVFSRPDASEAAVEEAGKEIWNIGGGGDAVRRIMARYANNPEDGPISKRAWDWLNDPEKGYSPKALMRRINRRTVPPAPKPCPTLKTGWLIIPNTGNTIVPSGCNVVIQQQQVQRSAAEIQARQTRINYLYGKIRDAEEELAQERRRAEIDDQEPRRNILRQGIIGRMEEAIGQMRGEIASLQQS